MRNVGIERAVERVPAVGILLGRLWGEAPVPSAHGPVRAAARRGRVRAPVLIPFFAFALGAGINLRHAEASASAR